MPTFIECTSLSISYDILGIATVSYTVVSDTSGINVYNIITTGGVTFKGYITNASTNQIPKTDWYETHATLVAIATTA
jgi:hypothetical protein